jgi:ribonuclease HII
LNGKYIQRNNVNIVMMDDDQICKKTKKAVICQLQKYYDADTSVFEIGVDEAGRGPLFGRVYTAAVVLPKDDSFDHSKMKDSKKFHSEKKILEVAEYIKKNAIAWHVSYEDETIIDKINILQATQQAMHSSILTVRKQLLETDPTTKIQLLIDGNYFKPISLMNKTTNKLDTIHYTCIEGGDNKYTAIAAASILAKTERDKYIVGMCAEHPELAEHYGIDSNKGYGAKKHIDGIKEHGISRWHRKSFGICKAFVE